MSLTWALNVTMSGLSATQKRMGTLSKNIANASTEGYVRKVQTQQTMSPTGAVLVNAVTRAIDQFVTKEIRTNAAAQGEADARKTFLDNINGLYGSPESDVSLSGHLSDLVSSIEILSSDSAQNNNLSRVIASAQNLASSFNTMYRGLSEQELYLSRQLDDNVATVNRILQDIDGLNKDITQAKSVGGDASDLEDQRDQLALQLAGHIQIDAYVDSTGNMRVLTAGQGADLVTTKAVTIQTDNLGNLSINGIGFTAGGGSLGGIHYMLNTAIPERKAQLDDIAHVMTMELNTAGMELFNDSGTIAYTGVPAQKVGYGERISVNTAFVANPDLLRGPVGTPVGETTLINLAKTALKREDFAFVAPGLPTQGSLVKASNEMIAANANETESVTQQQGANATLRSYLDGRYSSTSSVSVDDEMAFSLMLQNSYAASAKVVTAVSQMFDDLLNSVR